MYGNLSHCLGSDHEISHLSGSADGALYHWSGTERALLGARPDAHSGGARGTSVVGAAPLD